MIYEQEKYGTFRYGTAEVETAFEVGLPFVIV
jgi:hypothetical protein